MVCGPSGSTQSLARSPARLERLGDKGADIAGRLQSRADELVVGDTARVDGDSASQRIFDWTCACHWSGTVSGRLSIRFSMSAGEAAEASRSR